MIIIKINRKKVIYNSICLLAIAFAIIYITFINREGTFLKRYELTPFWSYIKAFKGDKELSKEILYNIMMFVPVGYIANNVFRKKTIAIVTSIVFSACIEIAQLLTHRGLFEFDDIVSNSIGGIFGLLICALVAKFGNVWIERIIPALLVIACVIVAIFYAGSESQVIEKEFEFQIVNNAEDKLEGYCFIIGKDAPDDYEIVLKDSDNKIKLPTQTGITRKEGEYFVCQYDYGKIGFEADLSSAPLSTYEIFVDFPGIGMKNTGCYLVNGEVKYSLENNIEANKDYVKEGYLLVAQNSCYVYQFKDSLYWVMDKDYKFEENGSTYIQYQLFTTQPDKLPQVRIENNWDWDNIGFVFEQNEIEGFGDYRVAVRPLPKEYSITAIVTGFFKDDQWQWKKYFRPVLKDFI